MSAYGHQVGADGSYPEIAARAVQSIHQQQPFPAYGYLRASYHDAKVYRFNTIEDARGWLTALVQGQAQPYEYAAVFAATDLSRPVPGLESFGHTTVSGDAYVGNVLPFLLGLPLGALGGYLYRGWQDKHPGHWIPGISGDYGDYGVGHDYSVGGPWLDMVGPQVGGPWLDMVGPQVGGPWLDMVGPQVGGPWLDMVCPQVGGPWVDMEGPQVGGPWLDMVGPQVGGPWLDMVGPQVGASADDYARRRAWPQTRALIDSAKREAIDAQMRTPAAAWVWSLEPSVTLPGFPGEPGGSRIMAFPTVDQAQAYMFERIGTPHVALALFDTAAARHWPNPVRWTKSEDPAYEPEIAQYVARFAPTRAVGDYGAHVGASTAIDSARDDVRDRARSLANKRAGRVVGVIHTTKDNSWHAFAFNNEDDADDWLNTQTQDQGVYTYAAYFDKNDATWPHPVIEKFGGESTPPIRRGRGSQRDIVGATFDDDRKRSQVFATAKSGKAVGVVRSADGLWSSLGFRSLNQAEDWLGSLTSDRSRFIYAAIYDKGSDGAAYTQDEEFGSARRAVATSGDRGHHRRGDYSWWAA